jgi:peptide/nickel transport system substrate-binding protein
MSAALAIADNEDREQAWFDIDTTLRSRGAYVALAERTSMYVAGSSVVGLSTHPTLGGALDLALIGVQ